MSGRSHYIDLKSGKSYCTSGCKPSGRPTPSKRFYAEGKDVLKKMPRSVDLRQGMTRVEQQRNTNSCTANALAGAYEFLVLRDRRRYIDVSRLFIYYNARVKGQSGEEDIKDEGSSIPNAIEALREFGCCKETMFPFRYRNVNKKPPQQCYTEAEKYRIEGNTELRGSLDEMKACLAEGYPFIFSLDIWQSFHQAEDNGGRVPMPDFDKEERSETHGRHAMLAVGYSNRSQCFIVRNSWGETWGDNGYCYIPYKYMCTKEHCRDKYCIKGLTKTPSHSGFHNAPNKSYDWYRFRNQPVDILPSNDDEPLGREWFWQPNDPHNYYQSAQIALPKHDLPSTNASSMRQNTADRTQMGKHPGNGPLIYIDSQKAFIQAIDYLIQNMFIIRSLPQSSTVSIICPCYQASDFRNILNLLLFLNVSRLQKIPILVITGDRLGALNHLEHEAISMHMHDWESRISVTDDSPGLMTKMKNGLHN